MLKRIYIDNYKSLVNFELRVGAISLLLGINGSGKSNFFEVLRKLRLLLVDKQKIEDLFKHDDCTRWQTQHIQTIEFDLQLEHAIYKYKLEVEHKDNNLPRIRSESLFLEEQPLLKFAVGEAQLYRDNGSPGPIYPFDWSQSAVASLPSRHDNTKLTTFKEALANLIVSHPIPVSKLMVQQSSGEDRHPSDYLENYVSWYRYLLQDGRFNFDLVQELREVLSDFDAFAVEKVGTEEHILKVDFRDENKRRVSYGFEELSDGQRMLIVLYTLLHLATHRDADQYKFMICLDEPENFVALREIQPWISAMLDRCQDGEIQLLLISHHPEIINYLLMPDNQQIGYWFERSNASPTRVKPIAVDVEQDGLPVSELIARGWLPNAQ